MTVPRSTGCSISPRCGPSPDRSNRRSRVSSTSRSRSRPRGAPTRACTRAARSSRSRRRATFPVERLALALNANTPADLVVRDAAPAPDGFSARFDALERAYDYLILNRRFGSALWRSRAWHVPRDIDDARFLAAAEPLIGEHDFITYCGELPERGGTVRLVSSIALARSDDVLRVTVRGNAFLHRMVRVMVGTLVGCATGYHDAGFAGRALASCERGAAGPTAPAHGLYLAGVRYAGLDTYRPAAVAP